MSNNKILILQGGNYDQNLEWIKLTKEINSKYAELNRL
jgi:hypothetical protein